MGKMGSIGPGAEADEESYVRFFFSTYGWPAGAIVRARVDRRDENGVHVQIWSKEDDEIVPAWSDLSHFRELTEMEVLALAAAGLIPEEQYGEA